MGGCFTGEAAAAHLGGKEGTQGGESGHLPGRMGSCRVPVLGKGRVGSAWLSTGPGRIKEAGMWWNQGSSRTEMGVGEGGKGEGWGMGEGEEGEGGRGEWGGGSGEGAGEGGKGEWGKGNGGGWGRVGEDGEGEGEGGRMGRGRQRAGGRGKVGEGRGRGPRIPLPLLVVHPPTPSCPEREHFRREE